MIALLVATLIVTLFLSILAAASTAGTAGSIHLDLGYLIYISSLQASLSTILSLIVGVGLAWSLNRVTFRGRELVVGLFAAAIVTPGIVVAFGLIDVWGRAGWLGGLNVPVFGLGGVVAAHLVLDGAFAARIVLARLDAIPEARLKTGQSLALGPWTRFATIDWPAIRGTLPGLGAIIFLLAFTSFPIVLLLGGGPAVQTLEVAIYSAVRLDFDLGAAVELALVQIALCSAIIILSAALTPISLGVDRSIGRHWRDSPAARVIQTAILALALLGFGAPLIAVLIDGADGLAETLAQPAFWSAALTSLGIAAASAVLTIALGLIVSLARAAATLRAARLALAAPAYAYLAVPAVTLSLGAFLLVRGTGLSTEAAGPAVVVVANTLLSLPFAIATLGPPLDTIARTRGRLIRSLGLPGWTQLLAVELPLVAPDIGLVLALSFCFSLGDLGVIALFGTQNFVTLPLLMVRALGAYRTQDAATIAALLLIVTIGAFVVLPRLVRRLADARA